MVSAARTLRLFCLFQHLCIEVWLNRTGDHFGPRQNGFRDCLESFFDSEVEFCAGFNILKSMLLGKVSNFFTHDLSSLENVALGSDEHQHATRRGLLLDLPQPIL